MRERFTFRGDSLWWFTELYLQKMRRLDTAVAGVLALEARLRRHVHAPARLRGHGRRRRHRRGWPLRSSDAGTDWRLRFIWKRRAARTAAWPSYLVGLSRPGSRECGRAGRVAVQLPARRVAFVHTAFWSVTRRRRRPAAGAVHRSRARRGRQTNPARGHVVRGSGPAQKFPRQALVGSGDAGNRRPPAHRPNRTARRRGARSTAPSTSGAAGVPWLMT